MSHSKPARAFMILCLSISSLASIALDSDRDQPMVIEADSAEFHETEGLTIYQGNVRLTQGSIVLQADRITHWSNNNWIAEGAPANYMQSISEEGDAVIAESNHMEYIRSEGILTLTEEARLTLTQPGTTLSGNQIEYDVQRHVLKASSQGESVRERVQVTIPAVNLRDSGGAPSP